ncbi:dihydrolipoamide dehydrogenase [candidate division MSBL1 archaeon SCGC-AAA382N08]|uniref:Dihydrolipoamide dehydrogenase n=1 Tax=candidate division MSBL1 archaeon SCGC-AAA382N08 TaxID=1698285 RepID=A0A133VQH8_9EURY|nr:dihydrolipoamide dehydrogenase [candidate division MSBL1 archaeon SCGC-AAA382N08]
MMDYDFIVIGGGTGNKVARYASENGLKTALIEPGPIGGTCLNRGCNPSKMLIHRANVLKTIKDAHRFKIFSEVDGYDFEGIISEIKETIGREAKQKEKDMSEDPNLDLYKTKTHFVDRKSLKVDGEIITWEKILISTGSRPFIPSSIKGLDRINFLTSDEALFLDKPPDRLIILGGGYIAAELGYFFELFGTDVSIIEMEEFLLSREDKEVARNFTKIASKRHNLFTNHKATKVKEENGSFKVWAKNQNGEEIVREGDSVLVALGRRPNSDSLGLENTNVETDDKDFIKTNQYLETTEENVWALGDVAGNYMFKHSADYETEIVKKNAIDGCNKEADFKIMPHAVFTNPEIGSVGITEQEALEKGINFDKGYAKFSSTAMGRAQKFRHGFVKVLVDSETKDILGCHILGHDASTLIHEITLAMQNDLKAENVADTIHIHPSLSKVIRAAFQNV